MSNPWFPLRCRISDLLESMVTCRLDTVPESGDVVVSGYAALMADGVQFSEPRAIRVSSGSIIMFDGHHRCLASQDAGETHIMVQVMDGERYDAILGAARANRDHGKPMSNADKRQAVAMILQSGTNLTTKQISEHVGCSRRLVQMIQEDNPAPKRACVQESANGSHIPASTDVSSQAQGQRVTEVPECRPVACSAGCMIPSHLVKFWHRKAEFSHGLAAIAGILNRIEKGREAGDKLWGRDSIVDLETHLINARESIKNMMPWALCPTCEGLVIEGCRVCDETGFVSEFRYNAVKR